MKVKIRELESSDVQIIADAFNAIGWSSHKPHSQYESYLEQQASGSRKVLVAFEGDEFAGYLTIVWKSDYQPFLDSEIPEIKDFNVLPDYRRKKIGTRLMDEAEKEVAQQADVVGIGVGMYPDYGNAQRLYVRRGYVPDGRGLTYAGRVLEPMESTINDDDLVLYFTKDLV